MSEVKKKPMLKRWWFWLLVVAVVGFAVGGDKDGEPAASQAAQIELPKDQALFVAIVSEAQSSGKKAENDMQLGGVKADRDAKLCQAIKSPSVKGWVGKVASVGANSDGKGVFVVEVAKDITLKTWNNALSDISSSTLIEPGTKLFNDAAALKKGDAVEFAGQFFREASNNDCLREASLSLSGKVKDPEFIFKFSSVAKK